MSFSTQTIKKHVTHQDYSKLLKEASLVPHFKYMYVVDVDTSEERSWLKVWDFVLDLGPLGTSCYGRSKTPGPSIIF